MQPPGGGRGRQKYGGGGCKADYLQQSMLGPLSGKGGKREKRTEYKNCWWRGIHAPDLAGEEAFWSSCVPLAQGMLSLLSQEGSGCQ